MKKYICILASAALFAACEQKTETVAPASPAEPKTEHNTTIVNPSPATSTHSNTHTDTTHVVTPSTPAAAMTPAATMTPAMSTTTESTTTTATATPGQQ